jgi:hypothetical protein
LVDDERRRPDAVVDAHGSLFSVVTLAVKKSPWRSNLVTRTAVIEVPNSTELW